MPWKLYADAGGLHLHVADRLLEPDGRDRRHPDRRLLDPAPAASCRCRDLFDVDGATPTRAASTARAIVALVVAILPVLPGFVRAATTPGGQVADPTFFDVLYTYAWFVTFALSARDLPGAHAAAAVGAVAPRPTRIAHRHQRQHRGGLQRRESGHRPDRQRRRPGSGRQVGSPTAPGRPTSGAGRSSRGPAGSRRARRPGRRRSLAGTGCAGRRARGPSSQASGSSRGRNRPQRQPDGRPQHDGGVDPAGHLDRRERDQRAAEGGKLQHQPGHGQAVGRGDRRSGASGTPRRSTAAAGDRGRTETAPSRRRRSSRGRRPAPRHTSTPPPASRDAPRDRAG